MNRQPVSKRQRFEVFKRDHFTCQYCGAQPPDVVLVVDHILPVCQGGESSVDNLTTSCEMCNQGKAGKPLSHVPIRPDADLLYLETQQEIAELRRYQLARAERDSINRSLVYTFQSLWCEQLPDSFNFMPSEDLLFRMLARNTPEAIETAIAETTSRLVSGLIKTYGNAWEKYMWGVLRNISNAEEG
jgi:hypothetical protein